ncbi:MAG: type II toxin-antitoxin system PrlF family antitoxin [Pseudomonadota bacterium]|nr:type II toxin-antitoxin system PrlF family antitoxin [Pseudomonadota bacterium]
MATLTSKGQVTIPANVRRMLGLKPGDQVAFVVEDSRVVLVREENRIEAAFGLIKAETSASIEDMEQAIRKRAGQ